MVEMCMVNEREREGAKGVACYRVICLGVTGRQG